MSADQELAATGGTSAIGILGVGLASIAVGVAMLWRKIAQRSASRAIN